MQIKENNAMETNTRLHPLLTAAAISITVFSAVGVATLTGLMPPTIGSQKPETSLEAPPEVAKSIEPAITHPVQTPKPVQKKPVARAVSTPVVYNDGHLATIQAVREVKAPGQHTGLGPIAGGIAGAVLGDQIGKGKGTTRKVLTVLGAAGGAFAGREIEKQARATTRWEVDVRRDDGAYETMRSEVAPPWQPGERVRLLDGRLSPV
jgi:outer membrane lipoprotein SlyB